MLYHFFITLTLRWRRRHRRQRRRRRQMMFDGGGGGGICVPAQLELLMFFCFWFFFSFRRLFPCNFLVCRRRRCRRRRRRFLSLSLFQIQMSWAMTRPENASFLSSVGGRSGRMRIYQDFEGAAKARAWPIEEAGECVCVCVWERERERERRERKRGAKLLAASIRLVGQTSLYSSLT